MAIIIGCRAEGNKKGGFHVSEGTKLIDCEAINNGGEGFTVSESYKRAADELIELIKNSSLTARQKTTACSDIETVKKLAVLEPTPEIEKSAISKLESVKEVLATSADLISIGIPLLQIMFALFISK